jgi:hypothetical protein
MFGMLSVVLNTLPAVSTPSRSQLAPLPKSLISMAAKRWPRRVVPA